MNTFKKLLGKLLGKQSGSTTVFDMGVDIKRASLMDTLFTKLDELPPQLCPMQSVDTTGELIVVHRSTGHHSVMDNRKVDLYLDPNGSFKVIDVKRKAKLVHKRDYNPYTTVIFHPGIYRVDTRKDFC